MDNGQSPIKQIAPDVYLIRSEAEFHLLTSRFAQETAFAAETPKVPAGYPCVVFLYVTYYGGADFLVSRAIPVSEMLAALA